MTRRLAGWATAFVVGSGTVGVAQKVVGPEEFDRAMKTIGAAIAGVEEALGSASYVEAKTPLALARQVLASTRPEWEANGQSDAVRMTREAVAALDALDTALSAATVDAAAVAAVFEDVTRACDACHATYREGDPGTGLTTAERDAALSIEGTEHAARPRPDAWRQLGGPHRNFRVDSAAVATAWDVGGPTRLWSRRLGEGYSSILADGDLLFTMYRQDDDEVIIALDAATGATRWQYAYHTPLVHNGYFDVWLNSSGPGPYSTPLIAGDTVFAVGVDGHFHALDKRTGEMLWAQDLVAAFDVVEYNAFASSPIAYGRTVILPLGGSGHGVVAFDRETGATVWRSPAFDLAPGSPVLIEVDGQNQLVVVGQQELVGLDPRDGRRLWSHPHANELGLNLSMPVRVGDNALFLSSGYDGGSRLIRLSQVDGRTTSEEIWFNNRMRVHFSNALHIDGLVLASTGDFGPAFVAALDVETGAEVWRERTFARAQMLDAGGSLVILDEDGELAVASVTLDGLQVHARGAVLTSNAWTPPTLVGSTLYVRDRHQILALDLDDPSAAAAEPR